MQKNIQKKIYLLMLLAALGAPSSYLLALDIPDGGAAGRENTTVSEQSEMQVKKDSCEYVREKLSSPFDVSVNIPGVSYITDGYTSALLQEFEECMQQKQADSLSFHHKQANKLLSDLRDLYNFFGNNCDKIDKFDTRLKELRAAVGSCANPQEKSELQIKYSILSNQRNDVFKELLHQKVQIGNAIQDCDQYIKNHSFEEFNDKLIETLQELRNHDEYTVSVEGEIDKRMR